MVVKMLKRENEKAAGRRLLRKLADGNVDALSQLYDIFAEQLFSHALWMTRNRHDAEDAVQNTFTKLPLLGTKLLTIRMPANYLFMMVHREALDIMRNQYPQKKRSSGKRSTCTFMEILHSERSE
jgi:DNA-directed RNA polymerase specialized sigma24 family protein